MVTTKGRYALGMLLQLAQQPADRFVSLKTIAERQQVSMKYLEMIVSLLNKGGLVESTRGKDGGYRLARKAEEITVAQVLRATEGSMAPVSCISCGESSCEHADTCLTLPMWQRLDQLTDRYLSGVTLSDLLNGKVDGSISY